MLLVRDQDQKLCVSYIIDFCKKKVDIGFIYRFAEVGLLELLVLHFNLVDNTTIDQVLHLQYFEEKIDIPQEFSSKVIISHGFHKEITFQDFPLRGKVVYLGSDQKVVE